MPLDVAAAGVQEVKGLAGDELQALARRKVARQGQWILAGWEGGFDQSAAATRAPGPQFHGMIGHNPRCRGEWYAWERPSC
jgi:hypothetical protein